MIALFTDSLYVFQKYLVIISELCLSETSFFVKEILYLIVIFLLQNYSTLSLYPLSSSGALVLKKHSALHLTWFFEHVLKKNLHAS